MKILILLLVLLMANSTFAQVGATYAEVIDHFGTKYDTGTNDDGTPFLMYSDYLHNSVSGFYCLTSVYYFNKKKICKSVLLYEPVTEINFWVSFLNEKYVHVEDFRWRDYENDEIITLSKDTKLVYIFFKKI